jgi:hypothetical protein
MQHNIFQQLINDIQVSSSEEPSAHLFMAKIACYKQMHLPVGNEIYIEDHIAM